MKSGESIFGYALRLARENAQNSLSGFFKNIECAAQFIKFDQYFSPTLAQKLHELTGHSIADNVAYPHNLYKGYLMTTPVICPKCIIADGIHKVEWQYEYTTYCFEHKNDLIGRCRNCDIELTWSFYLLKGQCHRCERDLSEDCLELPVPISSVKQRELSGDELLSYLDQLTDRIKRQRRPYDLMKEPKYSGGLRFEWSKLVREASEQMERGIRLPSPYVLLFHDSCYPFMDEYYLPDFYRFAKLDDRLSRDVDDAKYYVDARSLSFHLGIAEYDVKKVIEKKLVKPVKQKGWTRTYFDYRDWDKLLRAVKKSNENLTELEVAMEDASFLWSKPTYLLIGILTGKVAVKVADASIPSFKGILVDRVSAHDWYKQNAVLKHKIVITVSEAAKIMGRSNNFVYRLIDRKKLKSITANDHNKSVCVDSLTAYLETGN
jgi:hypothetical protein